MTDEISREVWFEQALRAFYIVNNLLPPTIVYCTSPLDLIIRIGSDYQEEIVKTGSAPTLVNYTGAGTWPVDGHEGNITQGSLAWEHTSPSPEPVWAGLVQRQGARALVRAIPSFTSYVGWLRYSHYFGRAAAGGKIVRMSGPFALFRTRAYICDPPLAIHHNSAREISRLDGPAIYYGDGWGAYAVNNMALPHWVITEPQRVTAERITREPNVVTKRGMLEKYGWGRYLMEINKPMPQQQDEYGTLYHVRYGDDWCCVVVVKNATPEPDGSVREFQLVTPLMRTAKDAVSWGFNLPAEQYKPAVQT